MTNPEEVIKKLLALAQGGTEHEAQLAAEKASEMALKYNIDLENLKEKPAENATQERYDVKSEQWVSNIVSGVTLVNAIKYYRHWNRIKDCWSYTLVGKAHNIRITISIVNYLITEVKRLNRDAVKTKEHLDNPESRGAYRKAFRLAASQRLYSRLSAMYEELRDDDDQAIKITGSKALVIANYFDAAMAEAEQFIKSEVGILQPSRSRGITIKSDEGTRDGAAAGSKISLNQQIGGSDDGVSRKRLSRA